MSKDLTGKNFLHDDLSFISNIDITLSHYLPYIRQSNITVLLYLNLSYEISLSAAYQTKLFRPVYLKFTSYLTSL